MNSLEIYFKL